MGRVGMEKCRRKVREREDKWWCVHSNVQVQTKKLLSIPKMPQLRRVNALKWWLVKAR